MPHFAYEVRDPKGELLTGRAVGPTHLDVVLELKKVGYDVVRVWQQPPMLPGGKLWAGFQKVPLDELALATRQLSMFFTSGVGLLRGLECIQAQGFSQRTSEAAADVARSLRAGKGLAESMALRSDVFSRVYVQLVSAGEMSGALDRIMVSLSDFLERDLLLQKRLRSALAYPLLIFVFSLLVIAFLLTFIFPMFVSFFEGMTMELPVVTRSLLAVTAFFQRPDVIAGLVLVLPFLVYQLWDRMGRSDVSRTFLSGLRLRLPLVGPLHRNVLLSRFAATLAVLLKAGVLQMTALESVGLALGNKAMEKALSRAALRIKDEGASLSQALAEEPLFPRLLVSLIAVGEEVGDLPRVLELSAANFDLEVETSVSRLTVVLEPLMLGVMGVFVGYVLLAVFLPVYGMIEGL